MATSLSLENDSSLAQGYIKVNGSTAATLTTSGITGNLTGNADTATKFSTTTGSAPVYACRAWVNFDGTRDTTGATSTANTNRFIRASGNVTSVLRNAVGDYTVTFTTAMSDANYSISGSIRRGTTNDDAHFAIANGGLFSTTQVQVTSVSGGGYVDGEIISVQIFGN
jgi:hypothetical protein